VFFFLVGSVLFIFSFSVLIVWVLFLSLFCVFCPTLHVSLDCPFLIAPLVFSNIYFDKVEHLPGLGPPGLGLCRVFSATFKNIPVISWRPVLFVEATGEMLYRVRLAWAGFNVSGEWHWLRSYKSNHRMITTTTVPFRKGKKNHDNMLFSDFHIHV